MEILVSDNPPESTEDFFDLQQEFLTGYTSDTLKSGDNGVYWAEDVSSVGIRMETLPRNDDACAIAVAAPTKRFKGPFSYDGKTPLLGQACFVPADNRATLIKPVLSKGQKHGYKITADDIINRCSNWQIDIPRMRVDPSMVTKGQGVYVKITLFKFDEDSSTFDPDTGLCNDPVIEGSCYTYIYIGKLCCDTDDTLIYPYFPPASSTYWGLIGMTIVNVSDTDGRATIWVYENDGDIGKLEDVEVDANSQVLKTLSVLLADPDMKLESSAGSGALGDDISFIKVGTNFDVSGFVMIANPATGESMGYLPLPSSSVGH